MAGKHLFVIHGRATKPTQEGKVALVRRALASGLRRVSDEAAERFEVGRFKFTFIYYGDILNRLLVSDGDDCTEHMIKIGGVWYEQPHSYDEDLTRLLERPTDRHTPADYRELLSAEKDVRALDDLARLASPVLSLLGLGERVIKRALPDLSAYLTSRMIGSEIRERLQGSLRNALLAGDDVALVSHSMGCIVAYDVLWKFSRMSEYRDVRGRAPALWVTIGNPLGEPAVRSGLYDAHEPEDGLYPTGIGEWVNVGARDDFVAHDGSVADDFREMLDREFVKRIVDVPRICNFWVGWNGSNPHKLYGYLNHPVVAAHLVQWLGP